jgi:hypothetical protein
MLIVGPVLALLAPVLVFKYWRSWLKILFGVFVFNLLYFLLYVSPIPEKLARLVFSEDTLKVPNHCRQTNQ